MKTEINNGSFNKMFFQKPPQPSPNVQNLRKKLTQLSLELEDKAKTISLLQHTIDDEDNIAAENQKDTEYSYQHDFRKNTKNLKERYEFLMDRCHELMKTKAELTAGVEALSKEKKDAKRTVAKTMEKMNCEQKLKLERERAKWKEGEKVRRDKWMGQKVEEIREITVKGLEPDIKRIVDEHKATSVEIEADAEMDKEKVSLDTERIFQIKRLNVEQRIKNESSSKLKQIQMSLEKKVCEENERHVQLMAKLRDQLSSESEIHRKWFGDELNKVAEFHASEVASVRALAKSKLYDMYVSWSQEKESLSQFLSTENEKYSLAMNNAKKNWDSEIIAQCTRARGELITKERRRLEKERDEKIDDTIRRTQEDISFLENTMQQRLQNESAKNEMLYRSALQNIQKEQKEWDWKLHVSYDQIESIERENRRKSEQMELMDEEIMQIESELRNAKETLEKRQLLLETEICQTSESSKNEVKQLINQKLKLENELRDHEMNEEKSNCEHKKHIDTLMENHTSKLLLLQNKVKDSILMYDKKQQNINEEIEEEETHLEVLHHMIKSYQSTSKPHHQ